MKQSFTVTLQLPKGWSLNVETVAETIEQKTGFKVTEATQP